MNHLKINPWALIIGLFVIVVALVGMETINNIDFAFSEISEQTLPVIEALEDARDAGLKIGSPTSEFVFLRAESKSNLTGLDIEKENIILAIKRYDVAISQYEELVNEAPHSKLWVSHGSSTVVALPIGCTQQQQAAGYSDKINSFPMRRVWQRM